MKKLLTLLLALTVLLSVCAVPLSSAAAANKTQLPKVTGLKITTAGKQKLLKLTWNKLEKADGYQVLRSTTGKTGSYKRIATLRSASKQTYTDKNLKAAKTYYYAIRAFQKGNGKTYFGPYAKVNLSTRLTRSAIQKKLVAANRFYIDWVLHAFEAAKRMDYSDTRPIPGNDWLVYAHVKSSQYQSVADLKKAASKYFVKSVYEEYIEDAYADFNGKLYRKNYDTGGEGGISKGTMKILAQTDTACRVKVVESYSSGGTKYSHTDIYKLVYKNGRWLFQNMTDSFSIYYQGNKFWK